MDIETTSCAYWAWYLFSIQYFSELPASHLVDTNSCLQTQKYPLRFKCDLTQTPLLLQNVESQSSIGTDGDGTKQIYTNKLQ